MNAQRHLRDPGTSSARPFPTPIASEIATTKIFRVRKDFTAMSVISLASDLVSEPCVVQS